MIVSAALRAAFFLSGAAGLIFQIVWFYECGLVLGSSVGAVTVVLSAFMAGLAAGNAGSAVVGPRLRRPLLAYGALEVLVALTGLAVTLVLPDVGAVFGPLLQAAAGSPAALNASRFLLAFALLAAPATAMGATLPILLASMCGRGDRFGSALGALYGWNTIGAVAGVVLAETVLIARVGIAGSAATAAALNLAAAVVAFALRGRDGRLAVGAAVGTTAANQPRRPAASGTPATFPPASVGSGRLAMLLGSAAVSGALLLAFEVVWFRLLSMYVLVTTLAVSLMLAVVLAGIGLGGLLAAAWLRVQAQAARWLPAVCLLAATLAVGSYIAFLATSGTQVGAWPRVLWFAGLLTLPLAVCSGVLFTLLGDAVHRERPEAASAAGWLTLANTAGAACGPPLAAYLLLPLAGIERTLMVLAVTYVMVARLAAPESATAPPARPRQMWAPPQLGLLAAALIVAGLALAPREGMHSRWVARAAEAYADDGSRVVAMREGPSETLFVMQQQWFGQPIYSRLITNGFSMSGTALQGQRYMRAFAYYPMLLHDGPIRRALVVCYGVGVTVGAVTQLPGVESIDVAEISRDVVAMSDVIYPEGARPLDDPRVRLHLEDGRFLLESTTARYDLITGEPPPPRTPGAVNIYTREYFQLVHDRLAGGGLATYWVPVARPEPGTDVHTIIRAFCEVFDDCSLWNATPFDLMLIGSRSLTGPRSLEAFSRPWQTPGLEARLREVAFERPEQVGATFIGDAAFLHELTAGTPPLTDDFPQRLRPVAGRPSLSDPAYGVDPVVTDLYRRTLDVRRAQAAFQASPYIRSMWPPDLIARTLPFFDEQALINRVYWEGGHPLAQIADLDRVLRETTLRTLPLWMLGSDEVRQRIAESAGPADGARAYARGLRALSGRDFAGAAAAFEAAGRQGLTTGAVTALRAWALARAGRVDEAQALAAAARPTGSDEQRFWAWLGAQLAGAIPPA